MVDLDLSRVDVHVGANVHGLYLLRIMIVPANLYISLIFAVLWNLPQNAGMISISSE